MRWLYVYCIISGICAFVLPTFLCSFGPVPLIPFALGTLARVPVITVFVLIITRKLPISLDEVIFAKAIIFTALNVFLAFFVGGLIIVSVSYNGGWANTFLGNHIVVINLWYIGAMLLIGTPLAFGFNAMLQASKKPS
jgi:hypothetical protein